VPAGEFMKVPKINEIVPYDVLAVKFRKEPKRCRDLSKDTGHMLVFLASPQLVSSEGQSISDSSRKIAKRLEGRTNSLAPTFPTLRLWRAKIADASKYSKYGLQGDDGRLLTAETRAECADGYCGIGQGWVYLWADAETGEMYAVRTRGKAPWMSACRILVTKLSKHMPSATSTRWQGSARVDLARTRVLLTFRLP
jgi:hypothetical protein